MPFWRKNESWTSMPVLVWSSYPGSAFKDSDRGILSWKRLLEASLSVALRSLELQAWKGVERRDQPWRHHPSCRNTKTTCDPDHRPKQMSSATDKGWTSKVFKSHVVMLDKELTGVLICFGMCCIAICRLVHTPLKYNVSCFIPHLSWRMSVSTSARRTLC
jgi:hypothetical protein